MRHLPSLGNAIELLYSGIGVCKYGRTRVQE
jgi:hypothetical protein